MNKITNLFQTYRQATWRTQRQWIGLALILVVVTVMVAGGYLNITAHTALAGREIQRIRGEITDNEQINADQELKIASLTSTEVMQERAGTMGFNPAGLDELTYIYITGYPQEPDFRPAVGEKAIISSLIRPEYTESLLEWFGRTLVTTSLAGAQQ